MIALTTDQKMDIARTYDIPPGKIAVVGGGYDHTLFTRSPKAPAGTVHLLYAGKLNRSKGVPWLLRALTKIQQHDWHLHMAGGGNGPEFDQCIELAKNLGPKVTVHGYVSHRRLSELMAKSHIQMLPSFFEGLPLVLFEGLASGCRIITTALSGFNEIFGQADPQTIDLIRLPPLETIDRPYPHDEALLEDALCQSILNMMAAVRESPDFNDPAAEKIAADNTWPKVFERTLSIYKTIVNTKSISRLIECPLELDPAVADDTVSSWRRR
jgi:glycosyltransferase involved in cell wall biosynthesis